MPQKPVSGLLSFENGETFGNVLHLFANPFNIPHYPLIMFKHASIPA